MRDRNFRIEAAEDGIHVYNRDGHHVAERCAVAVSQSSASRRDGAHAFYLGTELMKAEIAFRLGKRYAQDEPLDWGVAADRPEEDRTRLAERRAYAASQEGRLSMPMIRETIVTTVDAAGAVHIAPLGLIAEGEHWVIAPFRPSAHARQSARGAARGARAMSTTCASSPAA